VTLLSHPRLESHSFLLEKTVSSACRRKASANTYQSPWRKKAYPKLQILTIEDLLAHKGVQLPPLKQVNVTFRKAPKARTRGAERRGSGLFGDEDGE